MVVCTIHIFHKLLEMLFHFTVETIRPVISLLRSSTVRLWRMSIFDMDAAGFPPTRAMSHLQSSAEEVRAGKVPEDRRGMSGTRNELGRVTVLPVSETRRHRANETLIS